MSDDGHDHSHGVQLPHASFRGYMTGFVLSVILTAIPFWLVMADVMDSRNATIAVILALGSVQIVVHVVYFLHMDARAEAGWNLMSFLFTATLILVILVGSIWIMSHLHENTHPAPSLLETRNMP
jgi:cytochrome o ubiquinol oxidase operon protein cyoD